MFNKSLIIMLISFIVFYGPMSSAAENGSWDFLRAFSEELVKSNDDLKASKSSLIKSSLDNIPLAEPKGSIPPHCNPHQFTSQALAQYQNANQFGHFTKSYFDECSKYLTSGNILGILGLVKFSTIKYDVTKNPLIKPVTLTLSDGSKLESYIGVKDYTTARPWIILKCGVFCDITTSPSMYNFVINFFDQSPFNILFVSNYTGADYIKANSSLRLGGSYEVYDFYDIAQWLKYESPYKETVDSIHAVGVSLGGSAAMAVGKLSHLYRSKYTEENLFNSSTAICPVVNLEPTLHDMYGDTRKGKIFKFLTWKYLMDAAPYLDKAHDYLDSKTPPKAELFPPMLTDIVLRYGVPWEQAEPPGRISWIPENAVNFLRKNHFVEDYGKTLTVPTLAWASKDDHVVNFDLNTKTLLNLSNPPSTLGTVDIEFGDHCAFDTSYGYGATTTVLQSFILNNSPNFKTKSKLVSIELPFSAPLLSNKEIHMKQWWTTKTHSSEITLNYETFDPTLHYSCHYIKPYKSNYICRRHYVQSFSIEALQTLGIKIPQNETESQILTRKLNGMMRVSNFSNPIDGTHLAPTHLVWRDFQ